MMKLKLCISTCPNDTFAFDALIHHKVDTENLQFDVHLADIEELNKMAMENEPDITKLSYHAYAYVAQQYAILNAGSALGRGNGPLFVSKKKVYPDEVGDIKIAIPGKYTTAAILLRLAFPQAVQTKEYLFSDIESAILDGEVDAGVLIHEGRFTYRQKGLSLITDLGEAWEKRTTQHVPLGCIAVKRSLPLELQQKVDRVLRSSVEYALANPHESDQFVKHYAQDMNREVIAKHIGLFVNLYTVDLGEDGKKSVQQFFEEGFSSNSLPLLPNNLFVPQA